MSSTLDPKDDNYDQLTDVLKAQRTATQNAFRRKGERPNNIPPHTQAVNEFKMAAMSNSMRSMESNKTGQHLMQTTVIGSPYAPSVASFKDLKKVMLKDLTIETNHRGSYLLLRFLCPAMRMTAIMNVAEDEAGTVMPFALYFQDPESTRTAESILKEKGVIILKEPYFKVGTNGQYAVRVDQPTDIIWLSEDDPRVPTNWRSTSASAPKTTEYWKKKGNDLIGAGRFFEAIEMYTRALRSSPNQEEEEILHNNKALANLRIEAFDSALNDVSFIANPQDRSEKGLYRGGLALYGLRRFKEALETLEILVRKYPESAPGKYQLDRTRLRVAEQESGVYDFKALYKATKLRPPLMDNASYSGPIEVRNSPGRGRGLFTTKPVKAGELLLCEKAFSYCFAAPPEEMQKASSKSLSQSSFLIDVPGNRITVGTHADLIRDVSNKLARNPSLGPSFGDLAHRKYQGVACTSVDGSPVVDTFLVADTIHINCFGCPLTSRDMLDDPELNRASKYKLVEQHKDPMLGTTGIWTLASYINHSCDPTTKRSYIGDLQIVRAARDMPDNMELSFAYVNRVEEMDKKLSDGWGFQCDCVLCVDDRKVLNASKIQRRKLIKSFYASNASNKRKKDIIKELSKTFQRPPSEVPRIELWDLHFSLVNDFAKCGEGEEVVDQVLSAFSSIGFVIEPQASRVVVRRWGYPHQGATSAWLTLRNVFMSYGQNDLAESAKEYARITWMMQVGEDTTFIYDNPPKE
ncbi:SET and MYND domain-containing protein [Lachnellula occidentalis]|uniref:SET and MYND domain-containing protein n=1 Tax=Lachnellula occidentalis TaxID=215460 RepID=A0A8H8S6G1_9HELO|nr:SET and MYND domain-containing protein [Lachnellula occidentalis]